jgi:CRISPR-associated protein Cas2
MRYVIAYDIEEDRIRTRVAALLASYGSRVQKSVFECDLEVETLERLTERLLEELAPAAGGDDVRIYRLCADCYGASVGLGEVEEGAGGEPWILV